MTRWNPSNPALAGDEWPGAAVGVQSLASLLGRGPQIIARATQSVTDIAALIRTTSAGGPVNVGVDVYDRANPVGPDTQSWALALPVADRSNAAGWTKYTSGSPDTPYGTNAHTYIDDVIASSTSLATGATDQIRYQGTNPTTAPQIRFEAGSTFYDGDTGAGGATITGKRISSVEVVVVCQNDDDHSVRLQGQLQIGPTAFNADSGPQIVEFHSPTKRLRFAWYSNPSTGRPWTNADAVALTNGTDAFGLAVITKTGTGDFKVTAMMLQFRVLTERRVATGYGFADPDQWTLLPLLNPADDSSQVWSKVSGHEYLLLFTLTRGSGPAGLSELNTSTVAEDPLHVLTDAFVQSWTLDHGGVPLALAASEQGQIPALLYVAGSPSTADSLPYGDVVAAPIANGAAITQGISTHSTQSYGTARVLVSRGTGGQDAGLNVNLKKTSDDSLLAGPATIDVADVPADGKYHLVTIPFPAAAALNSAVPVYLELTSTSTVAWLAPGLLTRTVAIAATDAVALDARGPSIGGSTDHAGGDSTRDYPWAIGLAPSPPGTLASSALTQANKPTLARHTVVPATVGYAHLTWAATSLGGAFGQYEIQRLDGATWVTIYVVTSEAVTHVNDIDCHRNIASSYRIRVVRADGGPSSWANFPSVTIPTNSLNDVVISSNWVHTLALAFADVTESAHEWKQRGDDRSTTKDYYGRDYPVVWAPAEQSGEEFSRDLLIADDDDPNILSGTLTGDRGIFADVLALVQSTAVPSLVYSDGFGKRWNVAVACLPSANGAYVAKVTCTQVGVPAPVTTAAPW